MQSPSRLIARVRRLHTQGQPLNLSAAKRRWAVLVADTFAWQPFLGWRRLLAAAGIDYVKTI